VKVGNSCFGVDVDWQDFHGDVKEESSPPKWWGMVQQTRELGFCSRPSQPTTLSHLKQFVDC